MHIVLFRIGLFSREQVRSYPYKKFKLNPQKPSNHETQPSFIYLSDYQFRTILNLSKLGISKCTRCFSESFIRCAKQQCALLGKPAK